MPRPQRFCVFCGGPKLTHEHIFADWLRNYIPRSMTSHTQRHSIIGPKGRIEITKVKKISGDPHSRRVPVVCGKCNHGWMSELQQRAKPHLLPLILGQRKNLRPVSQATIAAWATMATMVAEFVEPQAANVTQAERTAFMETQKPPANWRLWIAHYKRKKWSGYWVHNSIHFVPDEHPSGRPQRAPTRKNSQESAFVIGELFIRAFSSPFTLDYSWLIPPDEGADHIIRIAPSERHTIRWPLPYPLTDAEAAAISNWTITSVAFD